jgi:hypothetical protein
MVKASSSKSPELTLIELQKIVKKQQKQIDKLRKYDNIYKLIVHYVGEQKKTEELVSKLRFHLKNLRNHLLATKVIKCMPEDAFSVGRAPANPITFREEFDL